MKSIWVLMTVYGTIGSGGVVHDPYISAFSVHPTEESCLNAVPELRRIQLGIAKNPPSGASAWAYCIHTYGGFLNGD